MEKPNQLLTGIAVFAICVSALAQTSGQPSTVQKSTDPFVERREEKAEAKKDYKAGKISKEQYDQERAEAKEKLKASGARGTNEPDLKIPGASSPGQ